MTPTHPVSVVCSVFSMCVRSSETRTHHHSGGGVLRVVLLPGLDQRLELAVLSFEEGGGRIEFRGPPVVHDQDVVAVHDRVEPVGDGEACRIGKFGTHDALDFHIGLHVHGRGRLVHDDDRRLPQQRPCDHEELPLSDGQVRAPLLNRVREGSHRILLRPPVVSAGGQADLAQDPPQGPVSVDRKGIHIGPHGARKQGRILWNHRNLGPQQAQPEVPDVDPVDGDGPRLELHQAQQPHQQRALPRPSPPHHPHLGPSGDRQPQPPQH
mmetsp:Transcript_16285/g.32407  ORF Transcript_16285/g.32407 Transcript_16285/m.32407 type:complete len:267 (-) Transcript_16285:936-1736(-)